MLLPVIVILVVASSSCNHCLGISLGLGYGYNLTQPEPEPFVIECSDFGIITNGIGRVDRTREGFKQITLKCDEGYELEGAEVSTCENGEWKPNNNARCAPLCEIPSGLPYGNVEIHGNKASDHFYRKGAIATYTCQQGYFIDPESSEFRVCLEGAWSGPKGTCVEITGCRRPRSISNGYFVPEKYQFALEYDIGQRLHYSCNPGYILVGTPVQLCLDDGSWSPKIAPVCERKGEKKNSMIFYDTRRKEGKK